MKRVLLLLYCLSLPFAIRAEVIDRIVAVVDGHIITASDMRQQREIREARRLLTQFQERQKRERARTRKGRG